MSTFLNSSRTLRAISLLIFLSLQVVTGVHSALPAEAPAPYQPDIEYYLRTVAPAKDQGFIKEEIKKYRSYPHLDRAFRLQREKRLPEACKEFAAYIAIAPDDIRARVSYLILLEKMSRYVDVIAQADLILIRWPSFVPAYFFKGFALQKMVNHDKAFAVFSAAAAVNNIKKEDHAFALSLAADIAVSRQKYEDAGVVLRLLTEIEKKHAWYMKAGFVFEKTAQPKESLKFYSAAQDSAQTAAEKISASLAVAEIAKQLQNREQAQHAYETALASDGSNQTALRGLAHLAYDGKKIDEAEKWMTALVRLGSKPEDKEFLAHLYLKNQNYAAAIPILKELADQQGKNVSVATLTALAQGYESAGRLPESAAIYKILLAKIPNNNGELHLRYGNLLIRMQKFREAEPVLDKALALGLPGRQKEVAQKNLALIYEKSGQFPQAAVELEKAFQLLPKDDAETAIRLALLYNKSARPNDALRLLDAALTESSLRKDLKLVALREKGLILEKSGKRNEAALEYEKALALGDNSPGMYLTLANLYLMSEKPEQAIGASGCLNKVLQHPDATAGETCAAEDGFGMFYLKQGRVAEAADHLSKALNVCGESWQRHYYLGLAHYRSQQWQQALDQFLLAEKQQKDAATLLGIALCQKELGRPGAAVHYLQLALQQPGVTPEQTKQIHDFLGYLYSEEYAFDKAADAFTHSLALAPDRTISLKLAGVQNRAEKTDEARKTLNAIAPGKLSTTETLEYNDLKSDLLQKSGQYEEALAVMEQTQKLQTTPARSYALGMVAQKSGQHKKAVAYFEEAYQKEPQLDDHALSLGYAYAADGRRHDAIGIFEKVAARNPDSVKVREELGYLNVSIGNNVSAVEWFKKALDRFPVMPQGTSEETDRRENDAHRLRGEITKLNRSFNATLYTSYRSGNSPNVLLANGGSGLSGQVGLEAAYRPPAIGLLNDRILELFGRVFGNLDTNSLKYNKDSTQAGIGLRYKFLQSENLWISAEKLIKIGDYALDDWLLRLLYSREKGTEPLPQVSSQDYYLIYGEVDGYLNGETAAVYAEVRKGRAFALQTNYLFTPHFVLDGRWQSPFSTSGNYVEGGAGISLKYFFNNSKYENFRNTVDLSVTYKHGMFINEGFNKNTGEYDTVLLSLGLFF
jgi:tetratricopeptide (TPR) repeat protein